MANDGSDGIKRDSHFDEHCNDRATQIVRGKRRYGQQPATRKQAGSDVG
jgi:hypothetical protein